MPAGKGPFSLSVRHFVADAGCAASGFLSFCILRSGFREGGLGACGNFGSADLGPIRYYMCKA